MKKGFTRDELRNMQDLPKTMTGRVVTGANNCGDVERDGRRVLVVPAVGCQLYEADFDEMEQRVKAAMAMHFSDSINPVLPQEAK